MLIGLTGKKRAGKDTFYRLLTELYPEKRVERLANADAVKQCICILFGITMQDIEWFKDDPSVKVSIIQESAHANGIQILSFISFRNFIQKFATDVVRDKLGEDIWMNMVLPNDFSHQGKVVCVTDVRFKNEAEAIRGMDGVIIKIDRPGLPDDDSHVSEAGIPDSMIDFTFYNNGSLNEFKTAINNFFTDLQ